MDCEKISQSTGNQPLVLLGLKGCANGVCTADGVGRTDAYLTGGTVTAVNVAKGDHVSVGEPIITIG